MKKMLVLFSLISLLSAIAASQTAPRKNINWQTFAPDNEEFSVETPFPLTFDNLGTKKKNAGRRYSNHSENTYIFIFSDSEKEHFQTDFVSNFIRRFQSKTGNAQIGNFQGVRYNFTDADDFYYSVLIISGENRFYVFQTVSETENNPLTEKFFASIQLNSRSSQNNPPENDSEEPNEPEKTITDESQTGQGSGRGSGSGDGGINNDAIKSTAEHSVVKDAPLNILSKPKANYTDAARFYQISGNVRIRMTFLAGGEIGAVTPITKLPFGLTTQAINAARQMRFEPAVKNGQPYSVTKLVEYVFTIY